MGTLALYNPVYVLIAFVGGDRIPAHGELHGFGFSCWKNGLPGIRYRNISLTSDCDLQLGLLVDLQAQKLCLGVCLNYRLSHVSWN